MAQRLADVTAKGLSAPDFSCAEIGAQSAIIKGVRPVITSGNADRLDGPVEGYSCLK